MSESVQGFIDALAAAGTFLIPVATVVAVLGLLVLIDRFTD